MQPVLLPSSKKFPPFSLERLLGTVFAPKPGERLCILIDLKDPKEVIDYSFLKKDYPAQKKAYDIFYEGLQRGTKQKFKLDACDFYAYQMTGGSNLELPDTVISPDGTKSKLSDIYSNYDIILCIGTYSATAPLTAASKVYGFRGATMHGVNDTILQSGLAVDYNEVSKETEMLRQGMTHADFVEVDFEVDQVEYHLHIELGRQDAQKSHGICHTKSDVVNLPAGEVYFVPVDGSGSFPIKFEEDGTLGLAKVDEGRVTKMTLIRGNQNLVDKYQSKLNSDPSTGILGELGFGTQVLPYADADIQDEKIFGTFHIATGRNDHLGGNVTKERFNKLKNASHDDILFSSTKTPEIHVKQVRMKRNGKLESLITNYNADSYLLNLLKKNH